MKVAKLLKSLTNVNAMSDSAEYEVYVYDENGRLVEGAGVQLSIRFPDDENLGGNLSINLY